MVDSRAGKRVALKGVMLAGKKAALSVMKMAAWKVQMKADR